MSPVETLFRMHLKLIIEDREGWLDLVADDATIEFPFASSAGLPSRFHGKSEIRSYVESLPKEFGAFKIKSLKIFEHEADSSLTAEFSGGIAGQTKNGADYLQHYVSVFEMKAGKIQSYREYFDPMPVIAYFKQLELP